MNHHEHHEEHEGHEGKEPEALSGQKSQAGLSLGL